MKSKVAEWDGKNVAGEEVLREGSGREVKRGGLNLRVKEAEVGGPVCLSLPRTTRNLILYLDRLQRTAWSGDPIHPSAARPV